MIRGKEQNLNKQLAEFGVSTLFQMYVLAKLNTFPWFWKLISQFNTFNTTWEPWVTKWWKTSNSPK